MNTNDLKTALYEKMTAEQKIFRDWLKSQPPEEILCHTYEYTVREDIIMAMQNLNLSDEQATALLDSPSPLADVYRYFEKIETDYMDILRDSIENRANDILKEQAIGSILVIAPRKKPYKKEISFSLETLQHEVGGNIQALYPFDEPVALICDEEGKLSGKPLNRALRDDNGYIYDVIAGTFLVVGLGEERFSSLSPELISHFTEYFKTPELFIKENGKLLITPMEDSHIHTPFYLHSAAYAFENGGMAQYKLSYKANIECKTAIEQAIHHNYKDNRLDTQTALQQVIDKFGLERVEYILANTIRNKDWDGRISNDNKAWAKTIPMPEDYDTLKPDRELIIDKVNPGLTDLFVKQFRKTFNEQNKSSILQKLKQEPSMHKTTNPKKREPER